MSLYYSGENVSTINAKTEAGGTFAPLFVSVLNADGTRKSDQELYLEEVTFLNDKLVGFAESYRAEHNVSIRINWLVLAEAYFSARKTLSFLGMEVDELSKYNIVGHVSFWLLKLKPVSIITRRDTIGFLKRFGESVSEFIIGGQSAIDAYSDQIDDGEEIYLSCHVNEHFAFDFLLDQMIVGYNAEAEKNKSKSEEILRQGKIMLTKVKVNKPRLIKSFRKHNYSARAMAMMIENIFRTEYC